MTHQIAICDDDSITSTYIKTLVESWAADHGIPVSIRIFPSAICKADYGKNQKAS